MKRLFAASLLALSVSAPALGACDLKAVAFRDQAFAQRAQADAECQTLLDQVQSADAQCKVVKQKNKFVAKFRLNLNAANQGTAAAAAQSLNDFVVQNNLFASDQIATTAAVSNGCN